MALGFAFTLSALPTWAVVPATLVDARLGTEPVQIAGLRDDVLVFFDRDRRLREAPLRDYVQIRGIGPAPAPTDETSAPTATLALVDGSTLPGRWVGAGDDGEHLLWAHPRFGEMTVPVEDLVVLTLEGEPIPATGGADDIVRLANGDRLNGFVAGVTGAGLLLIPNGSADTITLPMDRVSAIRLANPPQPPSDADRVTFRDGAVLPVYGLVIDRDQVGFEAALPGRAMRRETVPLVEVARIALSGGGVRLLDLHDLPRQTTGGGEVFGLTMPPRFEPGVVRLHAPLTLRFELPPGATRFAAEAALPGGADTTDRLGQYADFELVVRLESGPLLDRYRFNADQPHHAINLALPTGPAGAAADGASGGALLLQLDAGPDGPVFDRLELHHPVLLVNPPEDAATSEANW